jgi:streptogramin lyase
MFQWKFPALAAAGLLALAGKTFAVSLDNPASITGAGVTSPFGVAVDASHNLLVVNTDTHSVGRFDPNHNYLGSFGSSNLTYPFAAACAPNGHTYVLDGGNVVDFDASLNRASSFSAPGVAISADSASNLYIADAFGTFAITKYSPAGSPLLTLTSANGIDFNHPLGVTLDKFNNIYIVDTGNYRIVTLDPNGNFLRSFSIPDPWLSNDRKAKLAAVADDGTIFASVGDPGFAAFAPDGSTLAYFPASGSLDGASGVALDGSTLYAAVRGIGNASNAQILVFSTPEPVSLFLFAPVLALLVRRRPSHSTAHTSIHP